MTTSTLTTTTVAITPIAANGQPKAEIIRPLRIDGEGRLGVALKGKFALIVPTGPQSASLTLTEPRLPLDTSRAARKADLGIATAKAAPKAAPQSAPKSAPKPMAAPAPRTEAAHAQVHTPEHDTKALRLLRAKAAKAAERGDSKTAAAVAKGIATLEARLATVAQPVAQADDADLLDGLDRSALQRLMLAIARKLG